MIHIKVVKKEEIIKSVILKGHANFAEYGRDIVCAGVSSILTTTVNGILSFDEKAIQYVEEKDKFTINVEKEDHITQTLLNNMIKLFHELEENYKKNINIESEELTC